MQKKSSERLDLIKQSYLKELERSEFEAKRHVLVMENFKKSCEEMKDSGEAGEISRAATGLHSIAVEMVKSQETRNKLQYNKMEVGFKATQPIVVNELMGHFEFTGQLLAQLH